MPEFQIVIVRDRPKMLRVNAKAVLADVVNVQPQTRQNRPMRHFVDEAMGSDYLLATAIAG